MAPDFLYSDGHQGVNLSTVTQNLSKQAHRKAHPEPRGVLGPLERRAVFSLDLAMHSSGWGLGRDKAKDREVLYTRSGPKDYHLPSHNIHRHGFHPRRFPYNHSTQGSDQVSP